VESCCSCQQNQGLLSEVTTCPQADVAPISNLDDASLCHHFEELAHLESRICLPLQAALCVMADSDADIADQLSRVCLEARHSMDRATDIITQIAEKAQEVKCSILAPLKLVQQRSKHHKASALLGTARYLMDSMTEDAKDLLLDFDVLRDHVQYLIDCAEAELDIRCAAHAGRDWQSAKTSGLRRGMALLQEALGAMDPMAEGFWRRLLVSGKSLVDMANAAQSLRENLCRPGSRATLCDVCSFCADAEELCRSLSSLAARPEAFFGAFLRLRLNCSLRVDLFPRAFAPR